ncbi:hypothetical protein EJB05_27252, partial [Eragrostis curvula]
MAAASSFGDVADLMVADDLYLIAVCQGRNQADATGLMAISDEQYCCGTPAPRAPYVVHTANNDTAAAETPVLAVDECSSSSTSSSSPPPPLAVAAPATGEDDATAVATCKICLDYVPPSHVHHASHGCAHAFCAPCLSSYISAKTQGGRISDVKCPGDWEDCSNVLDPKLCQGIISGEAFEALCVALCMSMVEGAGNFCYCPFNDCSEILVDDRGGNVPESECPYGQLALGDKGKEDLVVLEMAKGKKWRMCGFQFCYACGEPWGQSHHSSCNTA